MGTTVSWWLKKTRADCRAARCLEHAWPFLSEWKERRKTEDQGHHMWILCPSASIFFNWLKFFYHAQIIKCFCPQGTWKGLPFFTRKVLYFTSITVHNNCAVLGRIARESNLWHHDSCYQQAIACFTSCYPLQWDFKQVSNTEVGTCSANHNKYSLKQAHTVT